MAEESPQVTTTSTSKQFALNLNDFWKGLIVAVLTAPLTAIYTIIQSGSFTIDWKAIGLMAAGGFLSYIIKNFFTPSATTITPPPGVDQVTIDIPPPGKTIKSDVIKAIIIIFSLGVVSAAHSQSFFKPLPRPTAKQNRSLIARDSVGAPVATAIYQNNFRPLAGVTASLFGDNAQLAGGVGVGFQRNRFDLPSQKWVTQYSISGLVFLDTQAAAVGGLLLGLAGGIIQIGPGYNFVTKQFVVLTGFGIQFN